jgi:hypothetical protein
MVEGISKGPGSDLEDPHTTLKTDSSRHSEKKEKGKDVRIALRQR